MTATLHRPARTRPEGGVPAGSRRWGLPLRAGRGAAELVGAVVVAGLVSGVLQLAVGRLHIPFPSNVPAALLTLTGTLLLAGLLALAAAGRRRWRAGATVGAWAALSALSTLALALPLQGTRFYLGGVMIDQEFRLRFLTRLTSSPALADMTYADLPSFYPAGWFWVGGRLAALAGIPGWQAYKPWAITTMAVAAAAAFTLWSLVLRRPVALLAALATSVVGLWVGSSEPYSWLLAAALPPVAVLTWHVLGCRAEQHQAEQHQAEQHQAERHQAERHQAGRHRAALLGTGGFLGLCGAVYTLYLSFAALVVVALAVAAGLRRQAPWRRLGLRVLAIGVAALPLTLLVWTPYLLAWLRAGRPAGAAQRFLPPQGAQLPLPMLQPTVLGALCLAGTVWLVVALRRSTAAQALAVVVVCGYAWYGLSMLALAVGQTLLAFRIAPVIDTALAVAGALGLVEALGRLRAALPAPRAAPVTAGAAVLALVAAVSLVQTLPKRLNTADAVFNGTLDQAYGSYYPTGVTPLGTQDPQDWGRWTPDLDAAIGQLTGRPPQDLVLLTADSLLTAFRPYHAFQEITPHYANPLADFDGRRAVVERWSRATSPQQLVAKLDASPCRPPTVFVLRPEGGRLHLTLTRDVFPREPNVARDDVAFDPAVFSAPSFDTRLVGPFLVAVRR